MNLIAVKYLSEHLLELVESGKTKHLNENILYSIIDQYFEKENISEKEEEIKNYFQR